MADDIVGQPLTRRCAREWCDYFVTRRSSPSRQAKGYDRYCSRRCARLDQQPLSKETLKRRGKETIREIHVGRTWKDVIVTEEAPRHD
jgi:hypothetical protein